jgi:hypothetical protein
MNDADTPARDFIERLDRVKPRLERLATAEPPKALTDPEPRTGEQWDWGQEWAHIAEFPPYWTKQVRTMLAEPPDPSRLFGRVSSDPDRLANIERERHTPPAELWPGLARDLDRVRHLLADMSPQDWTRTVTHSNMGLLDMPKVFDEFLVGHLEGHADELERLLERSASS